MNNGEMTAHVARALSEKFKWRVEVLFDHGNVNDSPERIGTIRSWFGDVRSHDCLLADLDIAILLPNSNHVIVLIEIEESAASPKTLLGDVMATLIGDHITFKGQRNLDVGGFTRLVVLSHSPVRKNVHTRIMNGMNEFKARMLSGNSTIGCVVIDSFKDAGDLEAKLIHQIEDALANRES